MVFRKKCCENKESHIEKHWQNRTNMWLIYFDYLLSLCFGGFHGTHVAFSSRHTVCSFKILQMQRVVWKTVNIIRYGILLTAGGISHLQPNLQNFGLGTVSTRALEVIISLAFFFLAPEIIYVYTHTILKSQTHANNTSTWLVRNEQL